MRKPDMTECLRLVKLARYYRRESNRVKQTAQTFMAGKPRDNMFFLAGEQKGKARGCMSEARTHHTHTMAARWRRIASRAA